MYGAGYLEIYWDGVEKLSHKQVDLLTQVAETAVKYCRVPDNCEVSISIVSADEIRLLNRDYRGKDTSTDVLSFPVNANLAVGAGCPLGDIVICIEIAKLQADEFGHSFDRELAFLLVHGVLHLLGYDHETPEDETKMRAACDEILGMLNISREL